MLAPLLLLPVCMMTSAPGADVQTIARGSLSGIERPRQVVVRNAGEWRALWKAHAPESDPPRVDFGARTVIAVFLGSRRTAGYDVAVTAVERRGAETVVRYRESRPGRDQLLAQILTSPFHIVTVPAFEGAVTFVDDHDS
jgi:hypothetical protein